MRITLLRMMVVFAATIVSLHAALAQRITRTIDSGWKFANITEDASAPDFEDAQWQQVNLPHTWNAVDAFDDVEGIARTIGWYRRILRMPEAIDKCYTLRIGAANQYAEVYVNGKLAGTHIGGYTAFAFDITSHLVGGDNYIAIKVDNSHNPEIGPLSADFTFYGGIYRDVQLIETSRTRISPTYHASKGIFIRTPEVNADKAMINVEVKLSSDVKTKALVKVELVDNKSNIIAAQTKKVKLEADSNNIPIECNLEVLNPTLWDVEKPQLYTARVTLDVDGKDVDSVSEAFGIRSYSFAPATGLMLNGRHVKLVGTNRHQDYFGLGNALPDARHTADIEFLKEMGGNSLRVSHYPQHERVMEACDRLGVITSVEIPLVNAITISEGFTKNALSMVEEMIWQNFNHASVLIWAYMNEILLRRPSTDEEYLKNTYYPAVLELTKKLDAKVRSLDPSRYTMLACDHAPKRYIESGVASVPQIVGWNVYTGWYGGPISRFSANLDNLRKSFPDKVLTISEYGADADSRVHSGAPERFDYSLDYSELFHEGYFPEMFKRDYIASSNLWNLCDFGSETRGDAIPHTNLKGISTMTRQPKDIYFYYKAALINEPLVHVCKYTWTKRAGAETSTGVSLQKLKVYTNQPCVELLHNGKSLGQKEVENYHAIFEVPFVGGQNTLEAIAGEVRDGYVCYFELVKQQSPERLNVLLGASRYFQEPRTDVTWIPEQEYKPGSWGFVGGKPNRQKTRHGSQPASAANIFGTDCDPMYQTQRISLEAFKADMPAGNYSVYLHFAELAGKVKASVYNLGNEAVSAEGQERVFDVLINGIKVLSDFDIAAQVGVYAPIVERFDVDVLGSEGITIQFVPKKGEPVLNAVSIRKNF